MTKSAIQQAAETKSFCENASLHLLKLNKLAPLLESLGCQVAPVESGTGYRCTCPLCGCIAFVGTNGKVHKVFWRCCNQSCSTQKLGQPRNLLSLVRLLSADKTMPAAYKTISRFLGCARPYDLTNGKFRAEPDKPADPRAKEMQSFCELVDEVNLPF
jgi:hypothetical protein